MSSRGYILTFHSQIIDGNDFATNDHVALDASLTLLCELRIPVIRLLDVVKRLRHGDAHRLPSRYACITFDDGPDYDWLDLVHPIHGPQSAMHTILRKHSVGLGPLWWSRVRATSFVIASCSARADISGDGNNNPGRMRDSWWRVAQSRGLIDIGNHGWDHVHPSVQGMQGRAHLVEAFHKIDSYDEARLQIDDAGDYICSKAGPASGQLFAYPYGQVSDYLADEYLPRQSKLLGAVTTKPAPVTASSDVWRIPRYVSRDHFKSIKDLQAVVGE